jgi:hypothetical protein
MRHPKDIMDAHNSTTKRRRKKTRYGDQNIVAATKTTV